MRKNKILLQVIFFLLLMVIYWFGYFLSGCPFERSLLLSFNFGISVVVSTFLTAMYLDLSDME